MLVKRFIVPGVFLAFVFATGSLIPAQERAGKRAGAQGFIDSVEPCGGITGVDKEITFTAKATFSGEGFGGTAKPHTITLRLLVVDEEGNVVCSEKKEWEVPDGEHGCIKCPVSGKKKLEAGVYFVNATLTDQPKGGKKTKMDAKSCAVILGP
jgi:hypothetical protein